MEVRLVALQDMAEGELCNMVKGGKHNDQITFNQYIIVILLH